MTKDCVFESTGPPPDGGRFAGQAAVRAVWEDFSKSSPMAVFEAEETFVASDRCVVRWVYRWVYRWAGNEGEAAHVRGVDVIRVQDGKVADKLTCVKG